MQLLHYCQDNIPAVSESEPTSEKGEIEKEKSEEEKDSDVDLSRILYKVNI